MTQLAVETFLDTSVLIAAHDAAHPHHARSLPLLTAAEPTTTACGSHSLAEVYAVLSRLPGGRRQRPEFAGILVEQIASKMSVVPLSVEEYREVIRDAAQARIAGGAVFDALLLACARKVAAKRIYTWNLRHFQMLAPDLAERVVTP